MKGDALAPERRVLLEEACRIADRLDRLDALLSGDSGSWVRLVEDKGDPERQIVVVDRALAEARQQAVALKQLIAELRAAVPAKPAHVTAPASSTGKGVAGVTNLADWAPARSTKSTG